MTTAETLSRMGYRRISNKFGMVARIDRPDWLEVMRKKHPNWENAEVSMIADYYRRCVSKDVLTLPLEVSRWVPSSNHDPIGYVNAN
jgi:hypothetical protein